MVDCGALWHPRDTSRCLLSGAFMGREPVRPRGHNTCRPSRLAEGSDLWRRGAVQEGVRRCRCGSATVVGALFGMATRGVWSGSWPGAVICLLADAYAERASELWRSVVRREWLDLDAPVTCSDCGATDLEMWY